ncbi:MAG: hypothetical protein ABIN80_17410 [Dyadobacter sp.]
MKKQCLGSGRFIQKSVPDLPDYGKRFKSQPGFVLVAKYSGCRDGF